MPRLTEVEDHVEPARPARLGAPFAADVVLVPRFAAKEAEDVSVIEGLVDAHLADELFRLLRDGGVHPASARRGSGRIGAGEVQGDDFDGGEVVRGRVEGAEDGGLAARGDVLAGDVAEQRREGRDGGHRCVLASALDAPLVRSYVRASKDRVLDQKS